MRRSLLFVLSAMLAVTALGSGAAGATAQTISFVDELGEELQQGAVVNARTEDAKMDFGSGFNEAYCEGKSTPPIEYSLEIVVNGPESVVLDPREALPPFQCVWTGWGSFPWDFENVVLGQHEFFPNGDVEYPIHSGVMQVYGKSESPVATCYLDEANSFGGSTLPWQESGSFAFENYMAFPESNCGGYARMYGTVNLTALNGEAIQIQVQP